MKIIPTLAIFITLLSGCSQEDNSQQAQSEKKQVREQVGELSRKTEELQVLVESQAQKIKKLENHVVIAESTEYENGDKETISSVHLDTNHLPRNPEVVSYQNNVEIKLQNLAISSPDGRMVSDAEQQIVGGDLKIVSPSGTFFANDAIVEKKGDVVEVTAKSLRLERKPKSNLEQNQSVEDNAGQPPF